MSSNSIHEDFVNQVRASTDIVKVIGKYVHLHKKGNRFWGCCPFHNEKTPSFSVVPEKGFFYCFGCHAGGNAFKFISLIERISYYEAIKLQAENLNIPIPKDHISPEELKNEQKRQDILKVLELATNFFHNCLTKTKMGQIGLEYWNNRNVDKDTIEKFRLGYAPNQWDKLLSSFNDRGIKNELLIDAGLIVTRDNKSFDKFRNRIIIPIMNEFGKTVGFGGRVLSVDGKPKYLNSAESMVFNKRNLLFGLNLAKNTISKENFSIVVEGYMDAITMHSQGITNVVAVLGTAFTPLQCRKLMYLSPNIYLCYDNDEAGKKATIRAMEIAISNGARVKIINLDDCKDPDEFILKHGVDKLNKQIKNAISMMDYQINLVLQSIDKNTIEGKLSAISQILPLLKRLSHATEQNEYIIKLSNMLGIDEGVIRSDLARTNAAINQYISSDLPGVNSRKKSYDKSDALRRASRFIIKQLWNEPEILDYINSIIPLNAFPYKDHIEILNYISNNINALSDNSAAMNLSEDNYAELSHCLVDESNENIDDLMSEDCMIILQKYYLHSQYEKHRLLADNMQRTGIGDFIQELELAQEFLKQLDELSKNT